MAPIRKKSEETLQKNERSKQFKATHSKFTKKKTKVRELARLATFIQINVNQPEDAVNSLDLRAQKAFANKKPSIFNKDSVNDFINKNTFVVAFAHPTYPMDYIENATSITINCFKINRKLLFFDKNRKMMNVLPDRTAFKVQINDNAPMNVKTAMFDEKLELEIDLSKELMPIQKCVIYLNILSQKNTQWVVPQELINTFAKLQLAAPNQLLQNS
ncbi:p25 [Condylorrhiza vestigialis mutiple nucleopolyhedrovirus]|uniref:p25 n=1 Tax=Condylorrhiza vestigialis mutiple nucleopolyhedrovirus TaxID=1592576 RepID=A0A0B4UKR8_9ABAC|nr:p25 [Condylorrhiza vestigialis mutiple nucleopolyhedrovirus]AJD09189.1 p25 [Condylorrhiza vestigialis mutiple nucleopolyhedrovirus]